MKTCKYLIIGAGLAGNEAAKQLRRADPQAAIMLVGEEPHPPYNRPPLTKEFLAETMGVDDILLEAADFYAANNIELILGVKAEALDLATKTAAFSDGNAIQFDKAVLATGGRAVTLPLPGIELGGVHYLRTAGDAKAIGAACSPGKTAAIVGGGFIGLELAATLTKMGLKAIVIEGHAHIWSRFLEAELAEFFQAHCIARGVEFRTNQRAQEVCGSDRVEAVLTTSGDRIPCDLACIGAGIRPNVELAESAGLEVDNGVVVDEFLRTSHPDVFAAGDIVNFPDPISGTRRRIEHWSHAKYTGRLAAQNLTGEAKPYDMLSFVWSDIFDLKLKFLGNEHAHDSTLVRGEVADGGFTVAYLKAGVVSACFAVNGDSREFSAWRGLIQGRTNVAGREAQLCDANSDLNELM